MQVLWLPSFVPLGSLGVGWPRLIVTSVRRVIIVQATLSTPFYVHLLTIAPETRHYLLTVLLAELGCRQVCLKLSNVPHVLLAVSA
jgi:hypothetical protein